MRMRSYMKGDLDGVNNLIRRVFIESTWTRRSTIKYLKAGKGMVLEVPSEVVEIEGVAKRLPAAINGVLFWRETPKRIRMDLIAVANELQLMGYGRKLANYLDQFSKPIRTFVPEDDLGVQLFLKAAGFKAVKIKPEYYLDDETAYCFEKIPETCHTGAHAVTTRKTRR
jgi:ribosomal protein S18 acetylase RimI-like enzyme